MLTCEFSSQGLVSGKECRQDAYSNTSQLDLWGRGDLGGSERDELLSEVVEVGLQGLLVLLSQLPGLDFLLVLHFRVFYLLMIIERDDRY